MDGKLGFWVCFKGSWRLDFGVFFGIFSFVVVFRKVIRFVGRNMEFRE